LNTHRLPVCPYSSCVLAHYDQKGAFPEDCYSSLFT
jgi:hypothetical protein